MLFYFALILVFSNNVLDSMGHVYHPSNSGRLKRNTSPATKDMDTSEFWILDAQKGLKEKLNTRKNTRLAKNVILFLGDGMSIQTITAARILSGQVDGKLGERSKLSFEEFPIVGLSKTFCVDKQVPDSACSSTAYLCGIKANYGTIGVTANVTQDNCAGAQYPTNQAQSIVSWSQAAKKSTGIVTTTTVTNASPAGAYAHVSHRDYESDYNVLNLKEDPATCPDIAKQLVTNDVGKNINVILGGGLDKFLPADIPDQNGNRGERLDKRNLIDEWIRSKRANSTVVFNRRDLLDVDFSNTDYLLGLFATGDMSYIADSDGIGEPALWEMTDAAIRMLSKNENGFFLFVEGGRIDHAHHDNKAQKALMETIELSKAVQRAVDLTNPEDTLIVVTADHGHTMTINGYSGLNNNILGLSGQSSDVDELPYTTLSYANGPSYYHHISSEKDRLDLNDVNTLDKEFMYPSSVPFTTETHGGGDVAVFAKGPWAHLFSGVMEQNILPHIMAFASCVGNGLTAC